MSHPYARYLAAPSENQFGILINETLPNLLAKLILPCIKSPINTLQNS